MIKSRLSRFIGTLILAGIVAIGGTLIDVKDNTNINKVKAEVKDGDFKDKEEVRKVEIADEAKQEEAKNEENKPNEENIEKEDTPEDNNTNVNNEVVVAASKAQDTQVEPNNNIENVVPVEKAIQEPVEQPKERNIAYDNSNYISEIEQAIFQRVNQERAAAGVSVLSYNTTMEYYARMKSKDMGDNGYFNHKDNQGRLMNAIIQADGISYRAWGENIAYIQGLNDYSALSNRFMNNWMNSEGHKANILSSNFSSVGIGVYKIGDTYYATQEFYK